jgi:mono/diheme cytochrome c family protein
MHDNPRLEAHEDGANRQLPEGVVARGALALTVSAPKTAVPGQVGSVGEDGFPFQLSADPETRKKEIREILDRGESRFNISCLPCHGALGDGNGMVAMRGFRRPPSYHQERLRNAPTSHFYDVITNGFGAMPSYADHLTPEDRWKVIAYIRALQASQNAKVNDLTEADKKALEEAAAAGAKADSHSSSAPSAPAVTPTGTTSAGGHND